MRMSVHFTVFVHDLFKPRFWVGWLVKCLIVEALRWLLCDFKLHVTLVIPGLSGHLKRYLTGVWFLVKRHMTPMACSLRYAYCPAHRSNLTWVFLLLKYGQKIMRSLILDQFERIPFELFNFDDSNLRLDHRLVDSWVKCSTSISIFGLLLFVFFALEDFFIDLFLWWKFAFHLHDSIKVVVFWVLFKLLFHFVTLVSLVVNIVRSYCVIRAHVKSSFSLVGMKLYSWVHGRLQIIFLWFIFKKLIILLKGKIIILKETNKK